MTILSWQQTVRGWEQIEIRKPTPADQRPPYPRESVEIHSFWRRPTPIFHRRWDPGTFCDPKNLAGQEACGHAIPVELAEKIARPCRKCWP